MQISNQLIFMKLNCLENLSEEKTTLNSQIVVIFLNEINNQDCNFLVRQI